MGTTPLRTRRFLRVSVEGAEGFRSARGRRGERGRGGVEGESAMAEAERVWRTECMFTSKQQWRRRNFTNKHYIYALLHK